MPLKGKFIMPREGAAFLAPYFGGVGLTKGVATMGSESDFSVGAYHDNPNGSRDCGLMQIDIPQRLIGTADEDNLRSESLDPDIWKPVAQGNAAEAHNLYNQPWTRHGKAGVREWEPWVGYTTGWATFPEWWVWSRTHKAWLPTGQYVQRAIPGVANYHLVIERDHNRDQALFLARQHAGIFKVKGELGIVDGIVAWTHIPSRPRTPPSDGLGPRPLPNDGH